VNWSRYIFKWPLNDTHCGSVEWLIFAHICINSQSSSTPPSMTPTYNCPHTILLYLHMICSNTVIMIIPPTPNLSGVTSCLICWLNIHLIFSQMIIFFWCVFIRVLNPILHKTCRTG
jgi:hypothetical protein